MVEAFFEKVFMKIRSFEKNGCLGKNQRPGKHQAGFYNNVLVSNYLPQR